VIDYRIGDGRDLIAQVPDGCVDLVACSPPFLALRSYLPADHEHKHAEIGSEPDPATFLDTLLGLTAEWGRVLAPHGSIAIELGDTFSGSGASGWERDSGEFRREARSESSALGALQGVVRGSGPGWPRPKSLALIPQLYATSLAYGRNLLTGQESPAGQWLVRNVIVWHRPNPAVGALGDKFRPSTSYIVVATKSPKRWFDLTAVRTEPTSGRAGEVIATSSDWGGFRGVTDGGSRDVVLKSNPAGAPPLDCWTDEYDHHDTWTLTTQPSKLAHYAMWPAKLAERLVLSMCPAEVCNVCQEPRRRIEKIDRTMVGKVNPDWKTARSGATGGGDMAQSADSKRTTIGWTDCGHGFHRPGLVLEPFAGTGTTCCVAELHGRDSIGFDIDSRNRDLLSRRMEEVRRNLFGTKPEQPGQLDLWGAA